MSVLGDSVSKELWQSYMGFLCRPVDTQREFPFRVVNILIPTDVPRSRSLYTRLLVYISFLSHVSVCIRISSRATILKIDLLIFVSRRSSVSSVRQDYRQNLSTLIWNQFREILEKYI